MAIADVVVVPSRYEPFGLVAAEAMAAGTCVVVTATGGLAEQVEDGVTGLLVDVGDVDGLAAALGELLEDRSLSGRLARAGRDVARGRTWSAVAERTLAVYASVLALIGRRVRRRLMGHPLRDLAVPALHVGQAARWAASASYCC